MSSRSAAGHGRGLSARGLTLVELLVAMGILSVLAAIVYPATMAARRRGWQAQCIGNLKQIGQAVLMYQEDYNAVPPWVHDLHPVYLSDHRLLACPADPGLETGGWVVDVFWRMYAKSTPRALTLPPYPVSYGDFGYWLGPDFWQHFDDDQRCAYLACVLHGERVTAGSVYHGTTLRLYLDGGVRAVQVTDAPHRMSFWNILCDGPFPWPIGR